MLMGGDGATVPEDSKKWKTASIKIMSRDLKILPVSRDMNRKPTHEEELWPRNGHAPTVPTTCSPRWRVIWIAEALFTAMHEQ